MFRKLSRFLPAIVVLILFLSCSKEKVLSNAEQEWLLQQDSITAAIYPYHPPYQLINNQGNVDGIFTEYLERIEQKIDYTFKKKYYSTWPKLMDAVEKEEVDIIIEMNPTDGRKSYLNFYAQLFESPHAIVTRKDVSDGTKISDFRHKTIVLPEDYAIYEILKQKYPKQKFVIEKDELTCLQKLNSGEYDAYVGPKAVVHYLIRTKNLNNLKIAGETNFIYNSGIAVFKKNKRLSEIISKATRNISRKEEQDILDNWLFEIVTPFYQKTTFWIIFSAISIGLLLTILSISKYLKYKIRQKTKELRSAKENAEESDRLKTNFIRNISHEIRTPMNGIVNFSESLNDYNLTENKRREYTQVIINSGNQLISTIEDILEIAKLQSKQVEVHIEKTNLTLLINTLLSMFEFRAKEKNITLYFENELPGDYNLILIDKAKLNTVLSNIIDNAIQHTKAGYVKISCKIEKQSIVISIEDTGVGIQSDAKKNIIKYFSQLEKETFKNHGSYGLGLTLVKENTAVIGGKVQLVSEEEKGTTFTIILPQNAIQSNIVRTSLNYMKQPSKLEKQIILIAEDGEINFLFLKTVLIKMQGYDFIIHRAKDGKEALDLCKNDNSIDLVLMDIKMPIMDGYDATKSIKKIRPKLPVIAQTAYSTEEDIKRALDAGCDDFISKPVDRKILQPLITKYFTSKKHQPNH